MTPRAFSSKVRSDLNANVRNVQLKEVSPHYYALGLKLLSEFSDQRLSDLLYIVIGGNGETLTFVDLYGANPIADATTSMHFRYFWHISS